MDQFSAIKYPIEHPYKTVFGLLVKGAVFGAAVGLYKSFKSNDDDTPKIQPGDTIHSEHHHRPGMLYNQSTLQTKHPSTAHIMLHHIIKDMLISAALGIPMVLLMKYYKNYIYTMFSPSLHAFRSAETSSDADKIFQKLTPQEKELALAELAKKASASEFHEVAFCFFIYNHVALTTNMKKMIFDNAKNRLLFKQEDLDKLDLTKRLETFKAFSESKKLNCLHAIVDAMATENSKLTDTDQANVKFLVNMACERLYFPHVKNKTREIIKREIEARGMSLINSDKNLSSNHGDFLQPARAPDRSGFIPAMGRGVR